MHHWSVTMRVMAPRRLCLASTLAMFVVACGTSPLPEQAPEPVPADLQTPGILRAIGEVSNVLSRTDCVTTAAGSAWPVATDYMVTNAHVVAGGRTVTVQLPAASGGRVLPATVVLFDPEVDVAVLHVPSGSSLAPLVLSGQDPARGATGAVIGYPGGGSEKTVPAAVRGTENAEGHDMYGHGLITRRIEVLQAVLMTARVETGSAVEAPRNSSGLVVDRQGVVIGLVFAASTLDSDEGYALTPSQIRADVTAGLGRTRAVSTQDCTS